MENFHYFELQQKIIKGPAKPFCNPKAARFDLAIGVQLGLYF